MNEAQFVKLLMTSLAYRTLQPCICSGDVCPTLGKLNPKSASATKEKRLLKAWSLSLQAQNM